MKYENHFIPPEEIPQYVNVTLQPVEAVYKKVLYINWGIAYTLLISIIIALFIFILTALVGFFENFLGKKYPSQLRSLIDFFADKMLFAYLFFLISSPFDTVSWPLQCH